MNCSNCQAQIPENSKVCPYCGTPVEAQSAPQQPAYQQPAYQQPAYQPVPTQPAYQPVSTQPAPTANDPQKDALAGSCLTWGILGLAFSEVPILGIIFSIIARVKCGNYARLYGHYTGKAKVGSTLATLGLVFSIIFTVAIAIVIIVAISEADRVEDYYDAYRYAYKYY